MSDNQIMIEKVKMHDAKYDSTFKILFGGESKERTISFLNAVYGFTGEHIIADVDIGFASIVETEIRDLGKTVIFDVKCYDKAGRYFIIEMQKGSFEGYFERAIYYGSRQLVSAANTLWQNNKKQYESDIEEKGREHAVNANAKPAFYKSIPQVRVLSILDYVQFKQYKDYASTYNIARTSDGEIGTNIISWDFIELPKFHIEELELRTTMDRWLYLLNRQDQEIVSLTENILGNDPGLISAYKRLSVLSKQEEEVLESDMKSAMDTQSYISTKFNEGLEEGKAKGLEEGKAKGLEEGEAKGKAKGLEEGKAKGLEEGKAKGLEEGKANKSIEIARNMISSGLDSDTIARCTGLSKSEIGNIKSYKC